MSHKIIKEVFNYPSSLESTFERAFFVDVETTGLDYNKNEILTLSISVCEYETLELIDEKAFKFKPENLESWDKGAEKIHKITIPEALHFPDKRDQTRELAQFLMAQDVKGQPIVSHALLNRSYFDQTFLMFHFMEYNWHFKFREICTFNQSTINILKSKITLKNYKLSTACEHFGIELDHHDAVSDRRACEEIYRRLVLYNSSQDL